MCVYYNGVIQDLNNTINSACIPILGRHLQLWQSCREENLQGFDFPASFYKYIYIFKRKEIQQKIRANENGYAVDYQLGIRPASPVRVVP